tara:strand:- start:384 stop:1064 length:681 start_codon:yes stop_codon:yes gene_type:complete
MKNKTFWQNTFKKNLKSQRNFPNEELCRFLGRNYNNKKKIKVLELGCGSGANVPAILHHNMSLTAIDFSEIAIDLCKKKYSNYKKDLKFFCLNMLDLDKLEDSYDLIIDVFSSYNLNFKQNKMLIDKVYKKLRKKGIYFSYTPSKKSTSWIKEKDRFDKSTLNSFKRKSSPYFGNEGFFRFVSEDELKKNFPKEKFKIKYCEKISKTYNNTKEYFEFFTLEVEKKK